MTFARVIGPVACALVVLGLVIGFTFTGPPAHARLIELDQTRVEDLAEIARELPTLGGLLAHLPANIAGARTDGSLRTHDPGTGRPYLYRRLGNGFALCARFALPNSEHVWPDWQHAAGYACYRFDSGGRKRF